MYYLLMKGSNDRGNLSVTERDGTTPNPIYLPAQSSSCTSSTKTDETYQEPQTGASGDCELYESGENQLASYVTQWSEDSLNPIYYPAENSKYPETGEVYQDPPNGASQECELYDSGENAIDYFAKLKKDHNKPH